MKKRGVALLAALLAVVLLLPGCGKSEDGYLFTSYAYGDRTAALTVGDYAVPQDLYDYFYFSHLADAKESRTLREEYLLLSSEMVEMLTPEEQALALTEASLREYFAVFSLAKEYGQTLSGEEKEALSAAMEEAAAGYADRDSYLAALAEGNLSEECYYNLLYEEKLEAKVYDYAAKEFTGVIDSTDATVSEDIKTNFYAAVQIFVSVEKSGSREAALEKAQALAEKAKDASLRDFVEIAVTDGDDPYGIRYFTDGYSYEFFESAVKALREEETSSLIESDLGYHLIRRTALSQEYIEENFDSLRTDYIVRCYHSILRETADRFSVTVPTEKA